MMVMEAVREIVKKCPYLDEYYKSLSVDRLGKDSTGMTILGTVVKLFTGEALAATTATGLLSGAIGVLANPIALAVVAGGALTAGMVAYTLTQKKSTTEADKFAQSCKVIPWL